jgi:hypothetical protein
MKTLNSYSVSYYFYLYFIAIPTYKNRKPSFDILCRFGRFKEAVGTYVNKTTIKCAIPSIKDDPDSIYRETVKVTVA